MKAIITQSKGLRAGSVITSGLLLALGLGGCSSLGSSHKLATSAEAVSGVAYQLPQVVLRARVTRGGEGVKLEISQPDYVGDPQETYVLKYQPSPAAKDKLDIKVDTATMLLSSIDGEAEDRIVQALEAAVTMQAPKPEKSFDREELLYDLIFDPADKSTVTRLSADLSDGVNAHLGASLGAECEAAVRDAVGDTTGKSGKALKQARLLDASTRARADACRAGAQLATAPANINLDIDYAPVRAKVAADCAVGLCYRAQSKATMTITANGHPIGASHFMMPNGSDAIALDIARATLTKSTQKITLTNGVVATALRTKESAAEDVAKLPLTVYSSVLKSTAQIAQLRVNIGTQETADINAQIALLKAKTALEKAKKGEFGDDDDASDDGGAAGGGNTESAVEDPAPGASQPDTPAAAPAASAGPMISVILPGFGKSRGFGLTIATPPTNEADAEAPGGNAGAGNNGNAGAANNGNAGNVLGTDQVTGGSGGKKR